MKVGKIEEGFYVCFGTHKDTENISGWNKYRLVIEISDSIEFIPFIFKNEALKKEKGDNFCIIFSWLFFRITFNLNIKNIKKLIYK